MNLIEEEEITQRSKHTKTIMTVIIVLIVILLIISGILLYLINKVQKETLKLSIDNKSTSFADDLFVIENGNLYIAIKDFGTLMGYSAYNGDFKTKYSEDTTNCYISNTNETASYSLNSNTIYKKVTDNADYEYFELQEPVRLINQKLYVSLEGMAIGTNSLIQYDSENNQITVFSLDYLVNLYSNQFPNAAVIADNANFNNEKALRYGLVVITSEDKHYGVYNSSGNEIIGAKYASITFKEDSKEFTVTTDEGKMGILSSDGTTKIDPNYDEIKQISKELNYYLVNSNNKYGVINQNGNIVIYLEYDKIGIDESRFSTNGIDNPYILFDNCIPVSQNNKWGIFDINGRQILPVEYDEIGCVTGTQSNRMSNNVIIIPQYEAIVVGKENKYGIINSLGKVYIQPLLDSVYSVTTAGQDKYYMSVTRQVEENGRLVDKQETYDLDEYFELYIVDTPQMNTNTIGENNTTTATNEQAITNNPVSTNEQAETNTQAPTNGQVITNTQTTNNV